MAQCNRRILHSRRIRRLNDPFKTSGSGQTSTPSPAKSSKSFIRFSMRQALGFIPIQVKVGKTRHPLMEEVEVREDLVRRAQGRISRGELKDDSQHVFHLRKGRRIAEKKSGCVSHDAFSQRRLTMILPPAGTRKAGLQGAPQRLRSHTSYPSRRVVAWEEKRYDKEEPESKRGFLKIGE